MKTLHAFLLSALVLAGLSGCGGGGATPRSGGSTPVGQRTKWTVLVFLNSSNSLYPYAIPNVNQMAKMANSSDVRFVVQWKEVQNLEGNSAPPFSGTRRYQILPTMTGTSFPAPVQDLGSGIDMGSPSVLQDFLAWGMQNYPADHYALVIWNHGNGWQRTVSPATSRAVSYDDETGNAIQTWNLSQALGSAHIDILSFDACDMQMLEIADEVAGKCDLIAASEELTPGPGYPYDRVFQPFVENPTASPATLSAGFVTGMKNTTAYQTQACTQSVVQTSQISAIDQAVDKLALALIANVSALQTIVPSVRARSLKYAYAGDGRNYYDLIQISQNLQNAPGIPADVASAAGNVVTAVQASVLYEWHSSADDGSHGLAIDFSPKTTFRVGDYHNLRFAQTTHWAEWLAMAP